MLDVKYVQKLAKFVDDKMHDIADVTQDGGHAESRGGIAALAIADELHSLQRDRGDHQQLMPETSRALPDARRARAETNA